MKITTDKIVNEKLSSAIFIQFTVLTIQLLVLTYFELEGSSFDPYVRLISKLIVGLFFLRSIFDIYYKKYKLIIFLYIFFATVFLLNILFFPQNIKEIKLILFDFFIMCLPCFIFSLSIDNYEVLFNTLKKHVRVIFMVGIFMSYLIIFRNLNIGRNNYSMSLSYYLLILLYIFVSIPKVIFIIKFVVLYDFNCRYHINRCEARFCIAVYVIV